MKKLRNICVLEFKLTTRNFVGMFFTIFFPVLLLVLFATMYGNAPTEDLNGFGFVDMSVSGYMGMVIAVTGLMTLPLTVTEYRDKKILKRFMATPINPGDILLSQLIVNTVMTVIGIALLIGLGMLVYNLEFYGNLFEWIIAFLVTVVSIFSIGFLIGGIAKNSKAATSMAYLVYFPMLMLSGAAMPVTVLPDSIRAVSKMLPLTYGIDLMKGIWLGESITAYSSELIILLSVSVICIGVTLKLFKWE